MQLVLSNNRVLAHGENFLSMGGVVINTETGAKYENATVAECENCPSDIDSVGYEYHAGQFVPCAPYGKGGGNLAVLCPNSCKAIKDSGISIQGLLSMITNINVLWENASPTSNFAAQTITLASDDWDFLIIETSNISEVITDLNRNINMQHITSNVDGIYNYFRTANISSKTTVVFGAGQYNGWRLTNSPFQTTGTDAGTEKPLRIYGVKLGVTI